MDKVLKGLGVLTLSIGVMFYRLFVLTRVWDIIAVKMFNLTPIGLYKAFAIATLLGVFTVDYGVVASQPKDHNDADKVLSRLIYNVFGISVAWFISWLVF
jgi:hypothetical protein